MNYHKNGCRVANLTLPPSRPCLGVDIEYADPKSTEEITGTLIPFGPPRERLDGSEGAVVADPAVGYSRRRVACMLASSAFTSDHSWDVTLVTGMTVVARRLSSELFSAVQNNSVFGLTGVVMVR